MPDDSLNLASLISSRICHDLISPIGAVTNGLELLELSGTPRSPELDLVAQSASNVNARIRLFRLAFGTASPDQQVSSDEVESILSSIYSDGRLTVTWSAVGAHPRLEVRAALLALLCVEQAAPFGGQLAISEANGKWTASATSDRLAVNRDLWAVLEDASAPNNVPPAAVQFVALPHALQDCNRKIALQTSDSKAEIRF